MDHYTNIICRSLNCTIINQSLLDTDFTPAYAAAAGVILVNAAADHFNHGGQAWFTTILVKICRIGMGLTKILDNRKIEVLESWCYNR